MGVTSSKNSGNTNSAERKLVKTSYDLIGKPFINLLFTAMPGGSWLTPFAASGIQGASAKGTSDLVTDTLSGEKMSGSRLHKRTRQRTRLKRKRARRHN